MFKARFEVWEHLWEDCHVLLGHPQVPPHLQHLLRLHVCNIIFYCMYIENYTYPIRAIQSESVPSKVGDTQDIECKGGLSFPKKFWYFTEYFVLSNAHQNKHKLHMRCAKQCVTVPQSVVVVWAQLYTLFHQAQFLQCAICTNVVSNA